MKSIISLLFVIMALTSFVQSIRPIAFHIDIEPGGLPEGLVNVFPQYYALLQQLKAVLQGSGLSFIADVPMAFDPLPPQGLGIYQWTNPQTGVTKSLMEWTFDQVDGVVLMSYRDHASGSDGILDHGTAWLNYVQSHAKTLKLGVETNCDLSPTKITFCEEGTQVLEAQMQIVMNTGASYGSNFLGMQIEDYGGYVSLATTFGDLNSTPAFCRSLWLWDHSVITDTTSQNSFFQFAATKRICHVSAEVYGIVDSVQLQPKLTAFLQRAAAAQMTVDFLIGESDWTYTQNHNVPIQFAQTVINYVNSLPANNQQTTAQAQQMTTGSKTTNAGSPVC